MDLIDPRWQPLESVRHQNYDICRIDIYEKVVHAVNLLQTVAETLLVLMGEATHGMHEFYRTGAELTKILVRERAARG